MQAAVERLVDAGLLFRQGVSPYANYLFKHALVQDAAYGTLLREPRRALHERIAQTLEEKFAETADREPELLARHYTEAGLIERAVSFWGRAGQRSLERSAVAEATEQFACALSQIATLSDTPKLRRQRIKLQVAAANALMHLKGYAAPETRDSLEQARALIKQVEDLGEPLDDPLLLFSVLYGLWVASYNTFDGNEVLGNAAQFLTAAEKQTDHVPLMVGHHTVGISLAHTGQLSESVAHFGRARRLYDPTAHRPLATRFGQEIGVSILFQQALSRWMLGYPETALTDWKKAIADARDIGQATTLMPALLYTSIAYILCGNNVTASQQANELVTVAEEKGSALWKAFGILVQSALLAAAREADAHKAIVLGLNALRTTGSTLWMPLWLSYLAKASANIGRFDDARRYMCEATSAVKISK